MKKERGERMKNRKERREREEIWGSREKADETERSNVPWRRLCREGMIMVRTDEGWLMMVDRQTQEKQGSIDFRAKQCIVDLTELNKRKINTDREFTKKKQEKSRLKRKKIITLFLIDLYFFIYSHIKCVYINARWKVNTL